MNKIHSKKVSLEDVLEEVQALRREVGMFMPTESLDDYNNPKEIVAAYREAVKKYPAYANSQDR